MKIRAWPAALVWVASCSADHEGPVVQNFERLSEEGRAIQLQGIDGASYAPLEASRHAATLLIFIMSDCPVANRYASEIKGLCDDYEPKGVAVYLVHVDATLTLADAKKHAQDNGYRCPILMDREHRLVKLTGATMVPEACLVSPDLGLVYRGRIDDVYADYGKRRASPTRRDLREVLDAFLAGRAGATSTTRVIGCFIPN